jgi:hypothetical protein
MYIHSFSSVLMYYMALHPTTFSSSQLQLSNRLNLLGPRTCFSKHRIQSAAALENTSGLSVSRNTSNTSSRACKWLLLASSWEWFLASFTTRSAPNKGRQPDWISVLFASTNSQMQLIIWKARVMTGIFLGYLIMLFELCCWIGDDHEC